MFGTHFAAVEFYDHDWLSRTRRQLRLILAKKIGVDAARLRRRPVAAWNEDPLTTGDDTEFGRTTGMDRELDRGPYFAIHVHPAIHYTMGGIHINTETQVLDTNGNVIDGLFAAGEVSGGLHGNNRIGGNSIAETVIFGRQAGIQMAKYVRESK